MKVRVKVIEWGWCHKFLGQNNGCSHFMSLKIDLCVWLNSCVETHLDFPCVVIQEENVITFWQMCTKYL